jgi:hypothetical protein
MKNDEFLDTAQQPFLSAIAPTYCNIATTCCNIVQHDADARFASPTDKTVLYA